jgi:hypothetical protein
MATLPEILTEFAGYIHERNELASHCDEMKGLIIELCRETGCGRVEGNNFYAEPSKLLDKVKSMKVRLSLVP